MRTVNDIYSAIIAEKERQSELNGLTSPSKSAVWRLLFYIVAYAHYTLEQIVNTHQLEIEDMLNRRTVQNFFGTEKRQKLSNTVSHCFRIKTSLIIQVRHRSRLKLQNYQIRCRI